MSNYLIEGLSNYECHGAWAWADELLHNAPQTKDFFDPSKSLADIKNRHTQKQEWKEAGKSLQASETSKVFVRSNVTTMTNLKNEFRHVMEFAFSNKLHNVNQALQPKNLINYIKFREEKVYKGENIIDSFKENMSRMRILCSLSTATEGFPNINVDKAINKANARIEAYVKEHPDKLVNEKHKIHAFTHGEEKMIIAGIKNEKAKLACEIIDKYCFRIENVSTIHLGTEWKYDGKRWVRVPTDEPKIALVSKGTQRHTVTLDKDLFDRLKAFANKNNIFHVAKSTIRYNVKKSAEALGLKCTVHNLRATAARNLFYDLMKNGYTYEQALQEVSWKLFHGRTDITLYYINSALNGEE